MKKPLFSGTCTALVTPFRDGKINNQMVKRLLDRQMEAGIRAVVLSGTTGEGATLSDEEKVQLIRLAREWTGTDCLILAGSGSNDTCHGMKLSQEAEQAGADGLLVVSPYYNKATASGLVLHYEAIAAAVSLPVILYNVPTRTGVDMPLSVYERLSALPNFAGIKEASRDMGKLLSICAADLPVWSGNDDLTVPAMALGGCGVISVVSNLWPERMKQLTDAALSGDFERAGALQRELKPVTDLLFCEVNPIPVKAALDCLGLDCGPCRLPLSPLSPVHLQQITDFFR